MLFMCHIRYLISLFRLPGCLLLVHLCAGCVAGFQPLYLNYSNLPCVYVTIPDVEFDSGMIHLERTIRYSLQDFFKKKEPGQSCYYLDVKPTLTQQNIDVQQDGTITRERFILDVIFLLKNQQKNDLLTGRVHVTSSHNIVPQEFSNLIATQKTKEQLASSVAQDIQIQLASFLDAHVKDLSKVKNRSQKLLLSSG